MASLLLRRFQARKTIGLLVSQLFKLFHYKKKPKHCSVTVPAYGLMEEGLQRLVTALCLCVHMLGCGGVMKSPLWG